MSTAPRRFTAIAAGGIALALALAGCSSSDPLDSGTTAPSADAAGDTIVVGSQGYYSNEIIAEIYSQALEADGYTVDRKFQIGQRDAYMPTIESGEITLFPEYTGNLLQWYNADATERSSDDVYAALKEALPDSLTVLDQASATDQDSYTVTQAFADEWKLETIDDLANVTVPLTLGGAPELEDRPYGPTGLKDTYGIDVAFKATPDTTVDELLAGTVNIANVYTAEPRIETDKLKVLEDTKSLFLASNVVPLVQADRADEIADVINAVSAKLTPEGLVALNVQSTVDKMSSADIAKAWLADNDLG